MVQCNGVKFGTRVPVERVWDTFDLAGFKAFWGSFGALAIFRKDDFQTPHHLLHL